MLSKPSGGIPVHRDDRWTESDDRPASESINASTARDVGFRGRLTRNISRSEMPERLG